MSRVEDGKERASEPREHNRAQQKLNRVLRQERLRSLQKGFEKKDEIDQNKVQKEEEGEEEEGREYKDRSKW